MPDTHSAVRPSNRVAHRGRAVARDPACAKSRGLERMGHGRHCIRAGGGLRVNAAACDSATAPSAKNKCASQVSTLEVQLHTAHTGTPSFLPLLPFPSFPSPPSLLLPSSLPPFLPSHSDTHKRSTAERALCHGECLSVVRSRVSKHSGSCCHEVWFCVHCAPCPEPVVLTPSTTGSCSVTASRAVERFAMWWTGRPGATAART